VAGGCDAGEGPQRRPRNSASPVPVRNTFKAATLHVHRAYTHGEHKETKTGRARSIAVIGPLGDDLALWRERSEWSNPDDLVCPSLGRADRPAAAARQGGFLHLGNWRQRVFKPACARAGLEGVIPYNGRDTFASLLIYEGRPPVLVVAALGHGDTRPSGATTPASSTRPSSRPGSRSTKRSDQPATSSARNRMSPRCSHAARSGRRPACWQNSNLRPLAPERIRRGWRGLARR
jgi:hypothetical protein